MDSDVFDIFLRTEASAHRLDEYLQATIISVEKDHVQLSMRLIPGVAVSSVILASIDTNGDGVISEAEQRSYAVRVIQDLSLKVDGERVSPMLVSQKFPSTGQINEGLGEIQMEFTVDLPNGGTDRRIVLESRHQKEVSVYLVNSLVPHDPNIRIVAQSRNEEQSFYQLDYAQTGSSSAPVGVSGWSAVRGWMGASGFASVFRLGLRHIASGTDHLLFLLVLLLPAPLMVVGSRWGGFSGVRPALSGMLKIVTAFTAGHSITLALAALGLIRVPAQAIEVLIALSIFISALHAIRPIFPGREARIAAFFGLIHGLAFAATLDELGLARWERVTGILAFNLGVETMQLIVVAATLPSLVLISRTRAYLFLRNGGALFAGFASVGWIVERLFGVHNPVDVFVNAVAQNAVWIAGALFLTSLGCWWLIRIADQQESRIVAAHTIRVPEELP